MKVAIDVREACKARRTGKGQWVYGFTSELLKREVKAVLLSDAPVPSMWDKSHVQAEITSSGTRWHLRAARLLHQMGDIDVYVSSTSYIVPTLVGKSIRTVPIVHDLIAFRSEPHSLKASIIERMLLRRVVQNAFHICTVSESTRRDLIERYSFLPGGHVTAIFAGPLRENPQRNRPDGQTILCIGTLCPRKNQLRLIQAYDMLHPSLKTQYKLVLAGGRGWHDRGIVKAAQSSADVTWIGHVSDAEYEQLLNCCTILALPSLYEGFGLQLLDAIQRGIPILTSERGSIPEVTSKAALYVDPEDIDSIANGLKKLLTDEGLREKLKILGPEQAQNFSWKRTVDLFLNAVHDA